MNIKLVTEQFTQTDGSNRIIKTANMFIAGSASVVDTLTGATVVSKEMSSELIRLLDAVPEGGRLTVTYSMQVTEYNPSADIMKEVRKLQERVAILEEQNKLLLEGLQQRVPLKTFKQWISLMEKNFGKAVLDENSLMGIQGESLP